MGKTEHSYLFDLLKILLVVERNLKSVYGMFIKLWINLHKNRSPSENCKMLFHGVAKLILHRPEHKVPFKYLLLDDTYLCVFIIIKKSLLAVNVQITTYDGLVLLGNAPGLGERRIKSN